MTQKINVRQTYRDIHYVYVKACRNTNGVKDTFYVMLFVDFKGYKPLPRDFRGLTGQFWAS